MTELRLRIFHYHCSIYTDVPEARQHVESVFRTEGRPPSGQPDIRFTLRKTARKKHSYQLLAGQTPLGAFDDAVSAVMALDHQLLALPVKTGKELAVFHSAWLAKKNRAVLLPGAGGAGKSTLCYALSRRGMSCGSDEAAAFLTGSGILVPFSRKLLMKPGSPYASFADSAMGRDNVLCRMDGRRYLAPEKWARAAPYKLLFIFPRYDPKAPPAEAAALATEQALRLLLENLFRLDSMTQPLFCRLTRALGPGSAFRLTYSDTDRAADLILNRLGNS